MGAQSTIWTQLSAPNSPVGSIPFVYTDGTTIVTDVLNFFWNQTTQQLSLHGAGDQTGTDSLNLYKQGDSYLPNSQNLGVLSASSPGFTVSGSQGTGIAPTLSLSGDFIGQFSAWAAVGAPITFAPIAGIYAFARGVSGAAAGIGGELHFSTKADGGTLVDLLTLDNAGNLFPTTLAGVSLGKALFGFSKFVLDSANTGVSGAQVINKPTGIFQIAAGQSSAVITNNKVSVNSIVFCILQTTDGTATSVKSVIPAAGSFTVNLNANATGIVKVAFFVVSPDI